MDNRKFSASWGSGYMYQGTQIITMADITEDNGWFPENIERINETNVGDTVDCSCISGELFVTRIE